MRRGTPACGIRRPSASSIPHRRTDLRHHAGRLVTNVCVRVAEQVPAVRQDCILPVAVVGKRATADVMRIAVQLQADPEHRVAKVKSDRSIAKALEPYLEVWRPTFDPVSTEQLCSDALQFGLRPSLELRQALADQRRTGAPARATMVHVIVKVIDLEQTLLHGSVDPLSSQPIVQEWKCVKKGIEWPADASTALEHQGLGGTWGRADHRDAWDAASRGHREQAQHWG